MKKIILLLIVLGISNVYSQEEEIQKTGIRFPKEENFAVKASAHYFFEEKEANDQGLNYVLEIGYSGVMYALIGIEKFSALKGGEIDGKQLDGYHDYHAVIGFNLCHGINEQYKYNLGMRLVQVFRGSISEGHRREFLGLEGGVSLDITDRWAVGLKGVYDDRRDQEVFGWPAKHKFSSFVTMTFKILHVGPYKLPRNQIQEDSTKMKLLTILEEENIIETDN